MRYALVVLVVATVWLGGCDSDGDGDPNKTDCMPDDPAAHAAGTEVCDDGKDNDCDGNTDCCDDECSGKDKPAACRERCGDGADNDCDGETDENCTFVHVDAGGGGACALAANELPHCWGDAKELEGFLVDATVGGGTSCGLKKDGSFFCTGGGMAGNSPKGVAYSAVYAGTSYACGIRKDDGRVNCFAGGRMVFGQASFGETKVKGVTTKTAPKDLKGYTELDTSNSHICGLRKNGMVTCWGNNDQGQCDAPRDSFLRVAAGEGFSCGLGRDGALTCWGAGAPATLPEGDFERIAAGEGFVCGLKAEGVAICTGSEAVAAAPEGPFKSISAGDGHVCGLTTEDALSCWGACDEGACDPNWK